MLLEPLDEPFDVKAWFAKLDEYLDEPFMRDGRQQPPMLPPMDANLGVCRASNSSIGR
jgi:hypothetical protein